MTLDFCKVHTLNIKHEWKTESIASFPHLAGLINCNWFQNATRLYYHCKYVEQTNLHFGQRASLDVNILYFGNFSQKIENIKLCLFSWSNIIKPVKHIEAYGWSKQWIINWEGQNVKNLYLGNDYCSFVGSPVLSQAVQWIWTDTIFKKRMATTVSQGRLWGEHL